MQFLIQKKLSYGVIEIIVAETKTVLINVSKVCYISNGQYKIKHISADFSSKKWKNMAKSEWIIITILMTLNKTISYYIR